MILWYVEISLWESAGMLNPEQETSTLSSWEKQDGHRDQVKSHAKFASSQIGTRKEIDRNKWPNRNFFQPKRTSI